MGFLKSLKGKLRNEEENDESSDPTKQPISYDGWSTQEEKQHVFGQSGSAAPIIDSQSKPHSSTQMPHDQYTQQEQFVAPLGPPPSHNREQFNPPPGPPPSYKKDNFQPPHGPPPSQKASQELSANPPPYHDWTVIPDTALFPPPPAVPHEFSANNASYSSAEKAHAWCARYPLFTPSTPSREVYSAVQNGQISLEPPAPPATFKNSTLRQLNAPGRWYCSTKPSSSPLFSSKDPQPDCILLSTVPLYFAATDHPMNTERAKSIYYEVKVISLVNADSVVAVGFASRPYPSWRLPGWQRASIGVHSDDGRRFVNDAWGGRDFTSPFCRGDVIGIGITFEAEPIPSQPNKVRTRVFFTRNGKIDGRWDMDEERDAQHDEGIDGLLGDSDQYAAIGVAGALEVEISFARHDWLYQP